jgi:hypothetical protein
MPKMPCEGDISLCSFRVRGTLVAGTATAAHCREECSVQQKGRREGVKHAAGAMRGGVREHELVQPEGEGHLGGRHCNSSTLQQPDMEGRGGRYHGCCKGYGLLQKTAASYSVQSN